METKVFRREDRVCDYLLPVRILKTWGQVENAERLLREPPFGDDQINISDGDVCRMKNGGGENAAVLLDFGIERLAGMVVTDRQAMAEHVRLGRHGSPYGCGQAFLIR